VKWLEARLVKGAKPSELYHWLPRQPESTHHFWSEPWWPNAYVVRLRTDISYVGECPVVAEVVEWDDEPDAQAYGDYWPWAQRFFEAGSMLSAARHPERFVHCLLNAHGLGARAEIWFALRYAWRRFTTTLRWYIYLRRRWERETGPPEKGLA
jgi:hypothetical protein